MDVNVKITVEAGQNLAPLVNSVASLIDCATTRADRMSSALETVGSVLGKYDCKAEDAVLNPSPAEPEPAEVPPPETAAKPRKPRAVRAAKESTPEAPAEQEAATADAAEPKAEEGPDEWNTKSDEEKLEAIRGEVTRIVKTGDEAGTNDLRAILNHFGVKKASELAPEQYDAFKEAVKRHYDEGESLEDIFKDDLA